MKISKKFKADVEHVIEQALKFPPDDSTSVTLKEFSNIIFYLTEIEIANTLNEFQK